MKVSALALSLLLLAAGCRVAPAPASGVRVAVSVAPQAELVKRIAGDRVAVTVMVPPGASDEDVSLSPRQIVALETVQLYLKVGHPAFRLETRYIDPVLARRPEVRVVDMSRGVDPIEDHGHEHGDGRGVLDNHEHGDGRGEDGDNHGEPAGDPHLWTSPRTMLAAAGDVAAALEALDPAHGAEYRANLARFREETARLDRQLRERLGRPGADRAFLVYHPSWGYFAREYGLEQIAIEAEGKEPGAARLIQLIDRARREKAKVVLVPEGFPRDSAQVIADAVGGRVLTADPLAPDWPATLLRVAGALESKRGPEKATPPHV